jgi:ubiquinone/menaquinone biosynthesis C-methylase UbiE
MAAFDTIAGEFERFRALPHGVSAAARAALWDLLGACSGASLLDLGAGTGRFGSAFLDAGDRYIGLDVSYGMLERFAEKVRDRGGPAPWLVQADGRALPFSSGSFDGVIIVQVLSGVAGWRRVLSEARRVLRPGGSVVLGRSVGPPDGLDTRLRAALAAMMAQAGADGGRCGAEPEEALAVLAADARSRVRVVAARWETRRSPGDFLARHRTGVRFAALPGAVREELLGRLAEWAIATFGSLEATSVEPYSFEWTAFRF